MGIERPIGREPEGGRDHPDGLVRPAQTVDPLEKRPFNVQGRDATRISRAACRATHNAVPAI